MINVCDCRSTWKTYRVRQWVVGAQFPPLTLNEARFTYSVLDRVGIVNSVGSHRYSLTPLLLVVQFGYQSGENLAGPSYPLEA